MTLTCPPTAVQCRAVSPQSVAAFTGAPAASSAVTALSDPARASSCRSGSGPSRTSYAEWTIGLVGGGGGWALEDAAASMSTGPGRHRDVQVGRRAAADASQQRRVWGKQDGRHRRVPGRSGHAPTWRQGGGSRPSPASLVGRDRVNSAGRRRKGRTSTQRQRW